MKISIKNSALYQVAQSWKVQLGLVFGLLLLVGSCNQDDDLKNDLEIQSQFLLANYDKIGISDAAHGGIDEFYFLAPTVGTNPKFHGNFHGNLSPVVEISDDFEFKTFHQVFTRTETGSKQITVSPMEETYSANWNTAETKAIKGKIYRVRVRINNRILGFVDVGIVSPQTKKLENNLIPVVENQTMRVVFRIEDKICPARIEVLPEEATIPVDGEQQFEAIVYNFYDEVLENEPIKWTVGNNAIASISQSGLAKGLEVGTVSVFAQTHDVSASASLTVADFAVAHYPFNGDATDIIGSNNGTVIGATSTDDRFGNSNSALMFNGANAYVRVPTASAFNFGTGQYTISLWIKTGSSLSTMSLFNKSNALVQPFTGITGFVNYPATGLIQGRSDFDKTVTSPSGLVFNDNLWHHVVYTRNGEVHMLYLDGALINTANHPIVDNVSNNQDLFIGVNPQLNQQWYQGAMDELKFYNVALTATQVLAEYNRISP